MKLFFCCLVTRLSIIGPVSDFLSKLIYFIFPSYVGLIVKGFLDSFGVPMKKNISENIVRNFMEYFANENFCSITDMFFFQEIKLFIYRILTCFLLISFLIFCEITNLNYGAFRTLLVISIIATILEYILITKIKDLTKKI